MTEETSPDGSRASALRWALFTVPLVVLLGFLAGRLGGDPQSDWFRALEKPSIFPPPMWFGIVWSILYVMLGVSLALVGAARDARHRTLALGAFAVQLAVNLAWSPVFFGLQQIKAALVVIVVLDVLVLLTILLFWRVRRAAALLLLPYLAWILFATVLNAKFLELNPDGVGKPSAGARQ